MTARWTGPWGDHRRYRVELPADDVDLALAGGEGLVFAAVVDRTGEAVALKMLTALPVDDYGRVAQRGTIFAEVEHPNLMRQVATFIGPALTTEEAPDARDFGIIYTVADWVPGTDLDDAVDGVDARTALGWVGQVARAVQFLHDVRTDLAPQGIVHRDIKPSNVRITPEGRAVLIDFGVARAFEATDLTGGVGTHLWRAPEVVGGVGEPGPASDAWGIGALAYWTLLREPPPLDSAASARERLVPAARTAGIPDPAGLAHHISRLLELQPTRRPVRLDRWADELDAVARRSTARRLAKPVAAGMVALVATGLAAWSFAPRVANFGRRDSAAERTAKELVVKSQQLAPTRPAVALAVAMEARHRDEGADTDTAVDRAYDALAGSGIVATLRGHADSVSGVAFSGDGQQVVSSSDDGTVRRWDVDARKEIEPHLTLTTGATAVATSRSGLVAAGEEDGTVWLWDPSLAGDQRTVVDAPAPITDVALSPDGSLLAYIVRDGPLSVVDAASGSPVWSLPGPYRGVAFGGGDVLVVGHGNRVDVLEPRTGHSIDDFDATFEGVRDVTASDDGLVVAAAGRNGQVLIHHRPSGTDVPIPTAHTGEVLGLDLRPDGKVLATASADGTAKVWDAGTGALLGTHDGHNRSVQGVAFAPTGTAIATAGGDGTVRLWRPTGGRELADLPAPAGKVHGVTYSPDGRQVAAADDAGMVTIWDAGSGEQVLQLPADPKKVFAVAYSPHGDVVATGGADGIVKLWDPTSAALLGELPGHARAVWRVAFASEGTLLASSSGDGTVRLWDWAARHASGQSLKAGKGPIQALAISPDGSVVASGDANGVVRVWNTATGQLLHQLDAHETGTFSLALSPDGRTLAAGGDADVVQVWKLSSEHRIAKLAGHTDTIGALAFSRDGSMLASGSDDRSVELWRTADWKRLVDFIADTTTVRALGFSPDGTSLVTGGGQGVVKIWPTTAVSEAEICADIAAQVTAAELREALDGIRPEACASLTG